MKTMEAYVSETVKKHHDAIRAGNYEEAERLEAEMKDEMRQRIDATMQAVDEKSEPAFEETVKKGNLTKTYKETIALYRETLELTKQMRRVKKMVRDHMNAQRKPRKKKEGVVDATVPDAD